MQTIDFLPDELKDCAYNLSEFGIKSYAWAREDVLKVIDFLETNYPDKIILGGDLYVLQENKKLKRTYDNWFYEPDLKNQQRNSSRESRVRAREYLEKSKSFPEGDHIYADLVIATRGQY